MFIVYIMLGLLLLWSIIIASFTYMMFWIEAGNSPYRARVEELAGGNVRALLLRGVLLSTYSQMLSIIINPLYFWRGLWNPKTDPASPLPTVILIHGLYHNPSGWLFYRHWLRQAGFTNIFAWPRLVWKDSIDDLLPMLDAWIMDRTRDIADKPIVIIGHSIGGVIARAYAQRPNPARKIAGVVTLSSPHQGSKLAALGMGKASQDIRRGAPFLKRLEAAGTRADIPHLAVYSPIDNMVIPAESQKVKQPGWTHLETAPVSHIYMLYHKAAAEDVLRFALSAGRGGAENGSASSARGMSLNPDALS